MIPFLWSTASAFCGFYVGGADASLYNDATMVVMLRDGTKTVLSMQNSYSGPPEDFALVIPVPEVVSKDDVKTLPAEIFEKVDRLAAPRLVEYWQRDPCHPPVQKSGTGWGAGRGAMAKKDGVVVEAAFSVAEYDIVVLSADDSAGLERWLRQEKYNIPDGAQKVLRPYVEAGTRFFVAKVDPERLSFDGDRAVLSPLRVAYDSEEFSLPIRLGLLNSQGQQDLLVHILGRNQRYDVANRENVLIPTNIVVNPSVKEDFGGFYEALFRNTIEDHPGAVVTEYAWQAGSCDPCPGPALAKSDVLTLGADLVGSDSHQPFLWTLTRLHYRYEAESLDRDLVFKVAEPIIGGRGMPNEDGVLADPGKVSRSNAFQGRYAIVHPWEGEVACDSPFALGWEGPPQGISASNGLGKAPDPVDLKASIAK